MVCVAKDRASCDGGYVPFDCRMYPLFPAVDKSGKFLGWKSDAARGRGKCPLPLGEITQHIERVRPAINVLLRSISCVKFIKGIAPRLYSKNILEVMPVPVKKTKKKVLSATQNPGVTTEIEWSPQKIKLAALKPYGANPRKPTTIGLEHLDRSISKFGLAEPISVQPDMTVIGGHQRLEILKARGIPEAWCFVPNRSLTKDELAELNVRLNRNVAGMWDWEQMSKWFTIKQLADFGFDGAELDLNFEQESGREQAAREMAGASGPTATVSMELLFEKVEYRNAVVHYLRELTRKYKVRLNGEALYREALERGGKKP